MTSPYGDGNVLVQRRWRSDLDTMSTDIEVRIGSQRAKAKGRRDGFDVRILPGENRNAEKQPPLETQTFDLETNAHCAKERRPLCEAEWFFSDH